MVFTHGEGNLFATEPKNRHGARFPDGVFPGSLFMGCRFPAVGIGRSRGSRLFRAGKFLGAVQFVIVEMRGVGGSCN